MASSRSGAVTRCLADHTFLDPGGPNISTIESLTTRSRTTSSSPALSTTAGAPPPAGCSRAPCQRPNLPSAIYW